MTPDVTPPDPLVGATINGRFRCTRRVGRGGFACVYEGVDAQLERRVAVKVQSTPEHADAEQRRQAVERFLREAKLASRLRHPNVVRVHDFGEFEDGAARRMFMVQDFLDGGTLEDLLTERGALPPAEAADIAVPLLGALAAAHRDGVVHRDVKPANVVLARQPGAAAAPTVIDFGVSKSLLAEGASDRLTSTGLLVGTPAYMAPEQCLGRTDVDHRADLWAVGVTLYEMLSGALPFDAPSQGALMAAILRDPPVPLRARRPVPASLAAVVERALRKEPGERYQSAEEFLAALLACPALRPSAPGGDLALRHRASLPPSLTLDDPVPAGARGLASSFARAPTLGGWALAASAAAHRPRRRALALLASAALALGATGALRHALREPLPPGVEPTVVTALAAERPAAAPESRPAPRAAPTPAPSSRPAARPAPAPLRTAPAAPVAAPQTPSRRASQLQRVLAGVVRTCAQRVGREGLVLHGAALVVTLPVTAAGLPRGAVTATGSTDHRLTDCVGRLAARQSYGPGLAGEFELHLDVRRAL